MSRYLDTDPLTGAVETFECDEATGDWAIRRVADVQPIIDRNKEQANHGTHTRRPGELDARWVASIPTEVAYKWLVDHGIRAWSKEDWPAVKRLLNSNEYRYLRTSEIYL